MNLALSFQAYPELASSASMTNTGSTAMSSEKEDADSLTQTDTATEATAVNIDKDEDRKEDTMNVCAEAIRYVMDNNQNKTALTTFKILKTLIANATDPGEDDRKKKISLSNPKIKRNIVEVEGALRIMKLAGFEYRVEIGQESLIFDILEAEKLQHNRELLSELKKSIKELEELSMKSQGKKRTSVVVQRKIEKKVERQLFSNRWNDDSKDRNAIVTRKYKHALQQTAKLQEKQKKGNELTKSLRPYVRFALVLLGVFVCCNSPGQTFNFALKVFVLYWISIIFVAIVNGGGHCMKVRV